MGVVLYEKAVSLFLVYFLFEQVGTNPLPGGWAVAVSAALTLELAFIDASTHGSFSYYLYCWHTAVEAAREGVLVGGVKILSLAFGCHSNRKSRQMKLF